MRSALASPAAPYEIKLLAEPSLLVSRAGEFAGYASLFGVADLGRDVVMPGAFAESLARRGAGGIRMLWQHDAAEPIGRWLDIGEDGRGLHVRGRLSAGVARARELASLLAEGALDGLSIGFRVVEAVRDRRSGLRRLHRLDLWEISLVTFPMLPGARVIRSTSSPRLRGEVESRSDRVRGSLRRDSPLTPPHPVDAFRVARPLPASGEREQVAAAPLARAIRHATSRLSTSRLSTHAR